MARTARKLFLQQKNKEEEKENNRNINCSSDIRIGAKIDTELI